MRKNIEMISVIIDTTNEETYKDSLVELFDHDEEAAHASFDKHYTFNGVNIDEVVKDAIKFMNMESYGYDVRTLGGHRTLLTVAVKDT